MDTSSDAVRPPSPPEHPRLFLAAQEGTAVPTVEALRRAVRDGWAAELWQQVRAGAERDAEAEPVRPETPLPGRVASAVESRNPDFVVVQEAGRRLTRGALAFLLTGEVRFKDAVRRQLEVLFDDSVWPEWIDQAHRRFGLPVDLRTGQLAQDIGIAYDWLAPAWSPEERAWVRAGVERRAIAPYLVALAREPWWTKDLNNWLTVILGGFGVLGMALDGEHPAAGRLMAEAEAGMERYLATYGAAGEFNEAVGYAGANRVPVAFYLAQRSWSGGRMNRLARAPFPAIGRWVMHTTVPPGRAVAFGDAGPEAPVMAGYVAALAAATGDGVLQWFYRQYARAADADPLELVCFDARIEARSPEGVEPPFAVFAAHGRVVVSRTGWDPHAAVTVVYGKAGREENHEHHDVGQVCVDGFGERLIVDLGSPSSYPPDFFDEARWNYYNASIGGHNVVAVGGRELRVPPRRRGEPADGVERAGRFTGAVHVPGVGSGWCLDATAAYVDVRRVRRGVGHLWPGVVAVWDDVEAERAEAMVLRWHTIDRAEPDAEGRFRVRGRGGRAHLSGLVTRVDGGPWQVRRGEHAYAAPHDRDRLGRPLEVRRESFVELSCRDRRVRLVTLCAVDAGDRELPDWETVEPGRMWRLSGGRDRASVTVRREVEGLTLTDERGRRLVINDAKPV